MLVVPTAATARAGLTCLGHAAPDLRSDLVGLGVEAVVGEPLLLQRLEGAEADVERHVADVQAGRGERRVEARREVQAGRGRRRRTLMRAYTV